MLQQISVHTDQIASEQQASNFQVAAALPQLQGAIGLLYQKLEESQSTQAALTRLLGNVRQASVDSTPNAAIGSPRQAMEIACKTQLTRHRMSSTSEINISGIRYGRCQSSCPCSCHRIRKSVLYPSSRKLLGFGSMSFAGIPMLGGGCNVQACKQTTTPSVRINYCLPTWLALRMISIWFTSSPLYGPELLIRVPRYVEMGEFGVPPGVGAIVRHDLESLRRCLAIGLCTPNDIYGPDCSLLLVRKHFRVCCKQLPLRKREHS